MFDGACGPGCALAEAYAAAARRAGPARQRQLRWVIGELHRCAALLTSPTADPGAGRQADVDTGGATGSDAGARVLPGPGDCAGWLHGPAAQAYLALAAEGRLRVRGPAAAPGVRPGVHPSTAASQRVRASVLGELAATRPPHPGRGPVPRPGPVPAPVPLYPAEVRALLAHLRGGRGVHEQRTWVVAALSAAGLRVGELADLTLDQVTYAGTLTGLRRNPPGPGAPYLAEVELPDFARTALRGWLRTREELALNDRVAAVFVTTHPTHRAGGGIYPRGLPVSARGLTRAHRVAVRHYLDQTNPRRTEPLAVTDLALGRLDLPEAESRH